MFVQTLSESPRNERGGQVSRLLLTRGQFGSGRLSVTWVEGGPGSEQQLHALGERAGLRDRAGSRDHVRG